MVAYTQQGVNLPIAGAAGALTAVAVAAGIALMPVTLLESIVVASRLPLLLGAAEPPLGHTARALLCFGGSVGVGAVVMSALGLLIGDRSVRLGARQVAEFEATPVVRRADAHPDAPPRPPVLATRELGAPLMSVGAEEEVERPLPRDLDTPLSEYDPRAFVESHPPAPIQAIRAPMVAAPAPLPRPATFDPGERFDTVTLHAPTRADVRPGEVEATVHNLLDRLEAGVARRAAPIDILQGNTRLSVAMESLRRLAAAG